MLHAIVVRRPCGAQVNGVRCGEAATVRVAGYGPRCALHSAQAKVLIAREDGSQRWERSAPLTLSEAVAIVSDFARRGHRAKLLKNSAA